jgi:membrane protein
VVGVTLLIGASAVSGALQDALDRIWRAPPRPQAGGGVSERLLSFGMIFGVGFLLIISLAGLERRHRGARPVVGRRVQHQAIVLEAINFVLSFGVVTAAFALITADPRVSVQWRDVWISAAVRRSSLPQASR